jgi:hypothetical protein
MNTAAAAFAQATSTGRTVAVAARPAPRAERAGFAASAAAGLLVLGLLAVLQPDVALADAATDQVVVQHHQRVQGVAAARGGAAADAGRCAHELAQRYLPQLPEATRQRITDQVRQEQREGLTSGGHAAFVQRRLALYEAELQRATLAQAGR